MTTATSANPIAESHCATELSSEFLLILSESLEFILSNPEKELTNLESTKLGKWIAENAAEALEIATVFSQRFLQNNWTGPPSLFESPLSHLRNKALIYLSDPEPAYRLVRIPEELMAAIIILEELTQKTRLEKNAVFCDFRPHFELLAAFWMHQRILEDKSSQIYEKIMTLLEEVNFNEGDVSLNVERLLLASQIAIFYNDFIRVNRFLAEAKTQCKHSSLLTGILGKRTKFQDTEYAQLVVELKTADSFTEPVGFEEQRRSETTSAFPLDVPLDDDTLLRHAHLAKNLPVQAVEDYEAAVLLVEGLVSQRKRARTGLQDEELLAYIQMALQSCQGARAETRAGAEALQSRGQEAGVKALQSECQGVGAEAMQSGCQRVGVGVGVGALQSRDTYAIRACALFHRSKLEGDKSRKTIRAMQQLETLMMSFRQETPEEKISTKNNETQKNKTELKNNETQKNKIEVKNNETEKTKIEVKNNRLKFALAVNLPPSWQVEEALGFLLLQNGCVKEAVNIFTVLELWEDVIECYQRIGQKVKAENLILKELAKIETPSDPLDPWTSSAPSAPSMWCRLGDIREDVGCYEKAWELSSHRSARSRRDLGRLLLKRKDFVGAAKAFAEGLGVNSIDAGAWFSLGYCQMKVGEFPQAELSFRRCVNLDPDNALAWNNLGSIALRGQDYLKAYRILQDSIKADYDNWNVWDNYQNACLKVKDFEEEMKACYRLLELKGQLNVQSLGLLVTAVTDGVTDIHGVSAVRLLPKVKELFGAMTVKMAENSQLWYLYAKLNIAELTEPTEGVEGAEGVRRKEVLQAVVGKLQRAFRYAGKEKDWEKEEYSRMHVLNVARELGRYQFQLMATEGVGGAEGVGGVGGNEEMRSVRSSCRVMLESVISKVEKSCVDFATGQLVLSEDAMKIFDDIRLMRSQL